MLSAENHPTVIEKYLGKELAHGRLIELHPLFVDRVHVSKFGAVPKKHQSGKWPLICLLQKEQVSMISLTHHCVLCPMLRWMT